MAKPILIVRVNIPHEEIDKLALELSKQFDDYHTLVVLNQELDNPTFETYNDCKGLPDIDIEKLINDLKK
jgi:hypothetical protein